MLPNTSVIYDRLATKSCAAEASTSAFTESSLAKSSRRTRSRSSEIEGIVNVPLLADGSTYSNPSFVREVANTLLLLADCKRLNEIGLVQSAEWSLAHVYQVKWF